MVGPPHEAPEVPPPDHLRGPTGGRRKNVPPEVTVRITTGLSGQRRAVKLRTRYAFAYYCLTQSNFEVIPAQGGHKGGPQSRGL